MADDELDDDTSGMGTEWKLEDFFHGPMSQSNADKLLSEYEPENCFLVRERVTTPGVDQPDPESRFCISLYTMSKSGPSKVHFRIRQSFDLWIIGGHVFQSLLGLIVHYRRVEIHPGATLQHPVPPRQKFSPTSWVVATLSYTKSPGTTELSFTAGDVCIVDHKNKDGWLWVTHVKTKETGFVCEIMVEELNSPNYDPDLESCEFYHAGHREDRLEQLKSRSTGTYFLRPSAKSPNVSVLCVNCVGAIKKFEIKRAPGGRQFLMSGRTYDTMDEIIHRYSNTYIDMDNKVLLTEPMLKRNLDSNLPTDDIYAESRSAMLSRECQLTSDFHCLVCKRRRQRGWKRHQCTLQRRESGKYEVLIMTTDANRRKPKELIDLEFAHLYPVFKGTHDKPHCLQLVICDKNESASAAPPDVYVLAADTQQQLADWMAALKPVCRVNCSSQPSNSVKRVSTLEVTVKEVKNLSPSCKSAYVTVHFNGVVVAKTKTNKREQELQDETVINWDEHFHFDFFPECVHTLTLHLNCNKAKNTKVGKHEVSVSELKLGSTTDFKLPAGAAGQDKVQLCFSVRRISHVVLQASKDYVPIRDIILTNEDPARVPECLRALIEVCQSEDLPHLARAVYKVFAYHNKGAELLACLLLSDIQSVSDENDGVLFRTTTMGTAALEVYLESEEPVQFVRECLGKMVQEIVRTNANLELKVDRLLHSSGEFNDLEEAEQVASRNAIRLTELLTACLQQTLQHCRSGGCPTILHMVSVTCQQATTQRFPQANARVLSAFFFLRLFCPALTTKFRLVFGPQLHQDASPQVMRSLQVAAKALQLFANQSRTFREACMEKMKPFVCDNAELFKQLNAYLTSPDEANWSRCQEGGADGYSKNISLTFELASLHDFCAQHLTELKELLGRNRSQALKNLISATEFLSTKLPTLNRPP